MNILTQLFMCRSDRLYCKGRSYLCYLDAKVIVLKRYSAKNIIVERNFIKNLAQAEKVR